MPKIIIVLCTAISALNGFPETDTQSSDFKTKHALKLIVLCTAISALNGFLETVPHPRPQTVKLGMK
jgi:hypothetical protein